MRCRPARRLVAAACIAGVALTAGDAAAQVLSDDSVLPRGSTFDALRLREPRQILAMEAAGQAQSYLVALGNMAFSSPYIMGGAGRDAGMSCSTCHSSGDANRAFFIPGISAYPGSADVTNGLFNPRIDDGVFDPLDIPSLRGIRLTAPYGHDGRFASLRAFTRNVIVNEFGGPQPSPLILDALVAYQRQFEFLPNDKLGRGGRLTPRAGAAALRGEALFRRELAAMGGQSCASCHIPSAQFTDGQQHDVGTAAPFETPTLLNANFTAPYFADGSARTYGDVIAHFDEFYGLGLTEAERDDLVAYLEAVGDGQGPFVARNFAFDLAEVTVFASTLDQTIADRNAAIVGLTVTTINDELREIREHWADPADREIRAIIAGWVLQMRRIDNLARNGDWSGARAALDIWRGRVAAEKGGVRDASARSLYAESELRQYLAILNGSGG